MNLKFKNIKNEIIFDDNDPQYKFDLQHNNKSYFTYLSQFDEKTDLELHIDEIE